jgi:hypothetical protein
LEVEMATVVADMSVSLDGFVAGPRDEVDEVFSWFMGGEETVETENPDLKFETDEASAAEIREVWLNAGILDAVRMSVVPVLLGQGIPLFGGLERAPVKLKTPRVTEAKGVTHLYYEVA